MIYYYMFYDHLNNDEYYYCMSCLRIVFNLFVVYHLPKKAIKIFLRQHENTLLNLKLCYTPVLNPRLKNTFLSIISNIIMILKQSKKQNDVWNLSLSVCVCQVHVGGSVFVQVKVFQALPCKGGVLTLGVCQYPKKEEDLLIPS